MKLIHIILILSVVSACTTNPDPSLAPKTPSNPGPELTARIEKLEDEVLQLRAQSYLRDHEEATVSTEEETYAAVRTKFGTFTFVCRGLTPYLDGYRVKLSIGNLTSATFNGAKLHISWGPVEGSDRKQKEMDLTNELRPGAYTLVEATLTPSKPEEIKVISIALELSAMSLKSY